MKSEVRRVAGKVPPPAEPLSGGRDDPARGRGGMAADARHPDGDARGRAPARGLRLHGADARRRAGPRADDRSGGLVHRRATATTATTAAPTAAARARTPLRDRRRRMVGSGALPGFAGGFGVRLAAGAAALSGELRGSLWPSRSTASTDDSAAGGTFDLIDGSAAGCARARHDQTCRRACAPARRWCACTDAAMGWAIRRMHRPGGPPRSPRRICACGSRRSTPCGSRHRWWSRWAARVSSLPGWVRFLNPQRFGYVEHWVGSYTFDPWARVPLAIHRRW